jgi:hypothetical protein
VTADRIPTRQIRAAYDDDTITVYQAYSPSIARPASAVGRFGGGFKRERMTWIKPSFRWMMYRCGWATKQGQEHVLAIRITRAGFEWALEHSAFAHYDAGLHADRESWRASLTEPVRIQWDPERDLYFNPLDHRSIQIGVGGIAVGRYCDDWIRGIEDVTGLVRRCRAELTERGPQAAAALLPPEHSYPVEAGIAARIGMRDASPVGTPGKTRGEATVSAVSDEDACPRFSRLLP